MSSTKTINHFLSAAGFFILILIFSQCANKSAPTGGPRDETPPVLIQSVPENAALNVSTTPEILLEFDEDVTIENAREQIIITPRIDTDFDVKARRNRIIMTFDSALADNTTYTINFRESIVDITESNPAAQLSLAFSTGPYIDSLSISGYVQHVQSGKPAGKATVALYDASDTLNLLNGLPIYFTETNDSGRYELRNIKSANYHIYSYVDENRNLMAETGSEPYGFFPDTLNLTSDLEGINMNLVRLDVSEFRLISARPSGTTFDIRLNKYITAYSILPIDTTLTLLHNLPSTEKETISIYPVTFPSDSTQIILTAYDSINQVVQDTLWIQFPDTERDPDEFTTYVDTPPVNISNPVLESEIRFNKPVTDISADSIFIFIDSAFQIPFNDLQYTIDSNRTTAYIIYQFNDSLFNRSETTTPDATSGRVKQQTPFLYLGTGAFTSAENDVSEATSTNLQFIPPSALAILNINISASTQQYFIQLLDSNGEIVAERPAASTIRFRNIPPGDYQLRAVLDTNENGKWDPGNILENQLPENIVYFKARNGSQIISLRANFDVTETFSF